MNPGRSIATRTSRSCSGIPCSIVGSGSVTARSAAVRRSTNTAARTTTTPRSNGPATAGTTTDRPNGAPPYGPGHVHAPAADVERQRPGPRARDDAPDQRPVAARPRRGVRRRSTAPRPPTVPAARAAAAPSPAAAPRPRRPASTRRWNGELPPATGLSTPAAKPGRERRAPPAPKHPASHARTSRHRRHRPAPRRQLARRPHTRPHSGGFTSTARGPPSNANRTDENGSCGSSSNTAVNCPLSGSDSTRPASFTISPGPLATRYTASSESNGFSCGPAR